MSEFFVQLFQSIFTPGPTPTLLVATNVSFACLQVVLFSLLIATYSIHFLILSAISGGLWWAINWFVREIKIAQAAEEERRKTLKDAAAEDSGDDTEGTETIIDTVEGGSGSKEVEISPIDKSGLLKIRHSDGSRSEAEASTEDEWERVSENEKDK